MAHHHGAIIMLWFWGWGCEGVHREPRCYVRYLAKFEDEMETGVIYGFCCYHGPRVPVWPQTDLRKMLGIV